MRSEFQGPVNIGSDEMVTINGLARLIMDVAGKSPDMRHIPGPLGVRGRNSDNCLIRERLQWSPSFTLREGIERTYPWIAEQVARHRVDKPGAEVVAAVDASTTVTPWHVTNGAQSAVVGNA
jgi:GDP-D-mannose 3', 5'-epimerase